MQISVNRPGRGLLAAAAVGLLALPAAASARPLAADLHVEAGGHARTPVAVLEAGLAPLGATSANELAGVPSRNLDIRKR